MSVRRTLSVTKSDGTFSVRELPHEWRGKKSPPPVHFISCKVPIPINYGVNASPRPYRLRKNWHLLNFVGPKATYSHTTDCEQSTPSKKELYLFVFSWHPIASVTTLAAHPTSRAHYNRKANVDLTLSNDASKTVSIIIDLVVMFGR